MAGNEALQIETQTDEPPLPPIAAAFLVNFDHRKGYVIAWQQSIEGVRLEDAVEFKSLPSGLHNVEEDLVYFIYEDYAGISAFISKKDEESARNASMLAVGVLVPLEHGRMGKSWRHADGLKELARKQIQDIFDTSALEAYWEKHKLDDDDRPGSPAGSPSDLHVNKNGTAPNGYQKSRSMSTGTVYLSSQNSLAPHHPAATLLEFLRTFGPLIYPLHRAALLRQRILIVCEPPVEFACNIVYNLSILSSLPKALLPYVPLDAPSNLKLRPLFNVGIHDIPLLEKPKSSHTAAYSDLGWIACTTDDVLSTKPDLFDILVLLPSSESKNARQRTYPRIVASSPELAKVFPRIGLRSTQRDAQRYSSLRAGLKDFARSAVEETPLLEEGGDDAASTTSAATSIMSRREIVEPPSWSQVAYNSLVWWASAGDRRALLTEAEEADRERDASLLSDDGEEQRIKEVALVSYFRRLTSLIFSTVAEAVARTDGGEEERYQDEESDEDENEGPAIASNQAVSNDEQDHSGEEQEHPLSLQESDGDVEIIEEDMSAMGLDVWSASDRKFVEDLIELWWGRRAVIRGGTIECCGVRIL